MDNQGFIERLQQLLKQENLTASGLANRLQVQRSTFSHLLKGRNNPSVDLLLKIQQEFPAYSIDWLLTGKFDKPHVGTEEPDSTSPPALKSDTQQQVTSVNIQGKKIILLNPDGTYQEFYPE